MIFTGEPLKIDPEASAQMRRKAEIGELAAEIAIMQAEIQSLHRNISQLERRNSLLRSYKAKLEATNDVSR
jgi:prefoldin subunit 5